MGFHADTLFGRFFFIARVVKRGNATKLEFGQCTPVFVFRQPLQRHCSLQLTCSLSRNMIPVTDHIVLLTFINKRHFVLTRQKNAKRYRIIPSPLKMHVNETGKRCKGHQHGNVMKDTRPRLSSSTERRHEGNENDKHL